MSEGKTHFSDGEWLKTSGAWLTTGNSTRITWETTKPWCTGHAWSSRNRFTRWLHRSGHRAGVLRHPEWPAVRHLDV